MSCFKPARTPVVLFQLIAVVAFGQTQPNPKPSSDHQDTTLVQQLQNFTEKQVADDKFSGVVLVGKSGKAIFERAYGMSDKKAATANRTDTKFDLGSMPKMFTAVAIAQLADAGKLAYSDPVGKYLPDYPDETVRKNVTIHQLLTHTAGFGNYFRPGFLERRLSTVKGYLSLVAEDPLIAEPGGRWQYSNSGYVVLGAIVEKVPVRISTATCVITSGCPQT